MPKLKLKRTPAEEREHELRKARKRAKRAAQAAPRDEYAFLFDLPDAPPAHADADADAWGPNAPEPGPSMSDADYERILRELEDRRFRAKLADALDADQGESWARLDHMESDMNEYAHVPNRWRAGSRRYAEAPEVGTGTLDDMEDDEYAEWVRRGMWRWVESVCRPYRIRSHFRRRRTHAAEFEAAERERAAHAERLRKAKDTRSETRRLEKAAREDEEHHRLERTLARVEEARRVYDERWKALLSASSAPEAADLSFADVPWPVLPSRAGSATKLEDIVPAALERFLVPPSASDVDDAEKQKLRKDRLRETLLRFHPDKFGARVLGRVHESDREDVKDGVGRVVRGMTELLQANPT
jgi:hypothetical protein